LGTYTLDAESVVGLKVVQLLLNVLRTLALAHFHPELGVAREAVELAAHTRHLQQIVARQIRQDQQPQLDRQQQPQVLLLGGGRSNVAVIVATVPLLLLLLPHHVRELRTSLLDGLLSRREGQP